MRRFTSPLAEVKVASPCPADWETMFGNDRVRFCGQCELNVYNLSAMSRSEAESLIARTEGRLCVRYYHRKDGSIITQDCPVGLRALKRRASRIKRAVASSVLSFLAGLGLHAVVNRVGNLPLDSPTHFGREGRTLGVMAEPRPEPPVEVGQLAVEEPNHRRSSSRRKPQR